MGSDTVRNEEVDAYWRRRVVALGGALATVGVLVWACSGSGDKQNHQVRDAAAVRTASASAGSAVTVAKSAMAGPAGSSPAPLPTVTITATAQVTVVPTPAKRAGDACDSGDVVVGLAPTKQEYGSGEHPQFRLSVVNTGQLACTLGVGPKELQIVVSSGSDRVWSSALCYTGGGSSIQLLQRGIPYGGMLEWDRKRSAPANDCSAHREDSRPGTYTVLAKGTSGVKTKPQVFHLR